MRPMDVVLIALAVYLAAGAVFAAVFITVGAKRIDAVAASTPLRTRLLFAPGAALLWPLVALRWSRAETDSHCRGHR